MYHNSKIQEKPFCQRAKHTDTFNTSAAIIGENPMVEPRKERPQQPRPEIHDKPFKPSNPGKRGKGGTLERFPNHVPSPKAHKKYVAPDENAP